MQRWTRARLDAEFCPVWPHVDTTRADYRTTQRLGRAPIRGFIRHLALWIDGEHHSFDMARPLDVGTYLTVMASAHHRALLRPRRR